MGAHVASGRDPITLADDLRAKVLLGLARAEPVAVGPSGPALETEIEELRATLAAGHAGKEPRDIPGLAPARDLYRLFGIDPTRTRPSSESLLRRVLQGKPLPRILNAVDLCNLCALRFLLPIGLYDAAKIRGAVTLRRGGPGESFEGIRKDDVRLLGRPVLADEEGPFGNPTSDSLRTSVTPSTRALWMVIFAPATFPRDVLASHVATASEGMARHLAPDAAPVKTDGTVLPDG
jgi:DNA/RNA-binding domain of Phe-tRNA-synthetase-like protein